MEQITTKESPVETRTRNRLGELAALFEDALQGFIHEASREPVANLHEGMTHALGLDIAESSKRGKRLRPVLCLLTAESLGAPVDQAYPFAVAIELMHNFCLVHDDLEDGDTMRRGRESVWVKYGLAHAINIGDYLLVQSHRALIDWGNRELLPLMRFKLLRLLESALDHTHVGQALDINARAARDLTVDQYMHLVREKTGYYLAAPIQGGAMIGGADGAMLDAIAEMAQFLGPMFQIMDDMIDLTEGKGREAEGSDIREGKRSFMVAQAASRCAAAERARLFDILDKPRDLTTEDDVVWVRGLFERTEAIEAGRAQCRLLFEESLPILEALPARLGDALRPVFESLLHRRR